MKCHYRIDDGPWIKGKVTTRQGVDVVFEHAEPPYKPEEVLLFHDPEILFDAPYIRVTGYMRIGDTDTFRLIGVAISPGWKKPK